MIAFFFVVLTSVILAIVLLATRTHDPLRERVHALQYRKTEEETPSPQGTDKSSGLDARARSLDRLEQIILRTRIGLPLQRLVLHAGLTLPISRLVLGSAMLALAAAAAAMIVIHLLLAALAAAAAAAALPFIVLRVLSSRRVKKFEAVLPDAIQLMARSLRAGHSVSAAMEMVGEEAADPLAEEFRQVSRQQRLGVMARDTLAQLAERVPSQDLRFLITAIQVQRENGGDLTEVLDRTAHVISERLRIKGEIRIYSAQGRLTGWILSLLPVALLLIISVGNPGYANTFFTDPVGKRMLMGAAASISVGVFFIRRIVDIKV